MNPKQGDMAGAAAGEKSQRLDKWLWYARVVKTRTLATRLVSGGKVRINREKTDKPSTALKVGDVVTVTVQRRVRVLEVVELGDRRGPASEAETLFADLTPGDEAPTSATAETPPNPQSGANPAGALPVRSPGAGRPTKRERRATDRLRGR